MDEATIVAQKDEIREYISKSKYELNFIDKRKIDKIKRLAKNDSDKFHIPIDIATYDTLVDNQIKKMKSNLKREYSNIDIHPSGTYYTASDLVGWVEIEYMNLMRNLKPSFFIDFRKYRKLSKKDYDGNISKNFEAIYNLQMKKLEVDKKFVFSSYRLLPKILKNINGGE